MAQPLTLSSVNIAQWKSARTGQTNAGILIRGKPDFQSKVQAALDKLDQLPSGQTLLAALQALGTDKQVWIVPALDGAATHCLPGHWPRDPSTASDDAMEDPEMQRLTSASETNKAPGGPGDGMSKPNFGAGKGTPMESTLWWDPSPLQGAEASCSDPVVGLAHELLHALHNGAGENLKAYRDVSPGGDDMEEARTIGCNAFDGESPSENTIRVDWNKAFPPANFPKRTFHRGANSLCGGTPPPGS